MRYRDEVYITRLATLLDAEKIASFQHDLWQNQYEQISHALELKSMISLWETSLREESRLGRALLCEENNIVVGIGAVQFHDEDAEIVLLEVSPDHTRRGVGSRLLNALADIAVRTGLSVITTWVPDQNTAMAGLLESSGWTSTGARRTIATESNEDLLHQRQFVVHVKIP